MNSRIAWSHGSFGSSFDPLGSSLIGTSAAFEKTAHSGVGLSPNPNSSDVAFAAI